MSTSRTHTLIHVRGLLTSKRREELRFTSLEALEAQALRFFSKYMQLPAADQAACSFENGAFRGRWPVDEPVEEVVSELVANIAARMKTITSEDLKAWGLSRVEVELDPPDHKPNSKRYPYGLLMTRFCATANSPGIPAATPSQTSTQGVRAPLQGKSNIADPVSFPACPTAWPESKLPLRVRRVLGPISINTMPEIRTTSGLSVAKIRGRGAPYSRAPPLRRSVLLANQGRTERRRSDLDTTHPYRPWPADRTDKANGSDQKWWRLTMTPPSPSLDATEALSLLKSLHSVRHQGQESAGMSAPSSSSPGIASSAQLPAHPTSPGAVLATLSTVLGPTEDDSAPSTAAIRDAAPRGYGLALQALLRAQQVADDVLPSDPPVSRMEIEELRHEAAELRDEKNVLRDTVVMLIDDLTCVRLELEGLKAARTSAME